MVVVLIPLIFFKSKGNPCVTMSELGMVCVVVGCKPKQQSDCTPGEEVLTFPYVIRSKPSGQVEVLPFGTQSNDPGSSKFPIQQLHDHSKYSGKIGFTRSGPKKMLEGLESTSGILGSVRSEPPYIIFEIFKSLCLPSKQLTNRCGAVITRLTSIGVEEVLKDGTTRHVGTFSPSENSQSCDFCRDNPLIDDSLIKVSSLGGECTTDVDQSIKSYSLNVGDPFRTLAFLVSRAMGEHDERQETLHVLVYPNGTEPLNEEIETACYSIAQGNSNITFVSASIIEPYGIVASLIESDKTMKLVMMDKAYGNLVPYLIDLRCIPDTAFPPKSLNIQKNGNNFVISIVGKSGGIQIISVPIINPTLSGTVSISSNHNRSSAPAGNLYAAAATITCVGSMLSQISTEGNVPSPTPTDGPGAASGNNSQTIVIIVAFPVTGSLVLLACFSSLVYFLCIHRCRSRDSCAERTVERLFGKSNGQQDTEFQLDFTSNSSSKAPNTFGAFFTDSEEETLFNQDSTPLLTKKTTREVRNANKPPLTNTDTPLLTNTDTPLLTETEKEVENTDTPPPGPFIRSSF